MVEMHPNQIRKVQHAVDMCEFVDQEAWADMGRCLTCVEVERVQMLLDAVRLHQQSEMLLAGHVEADQPGDQHYYKEGS